jgi:hypothetical protein
MRAISYRIRRLEKIVAPPVPEEGESAADVLRARRRRRLEAAGQPFVDQQRRSWTLSECPLRVTSRAQGVKPYP